MKRLALLAILALGCYHDNASPFVHGGGNRPPDWGSTWAPARGPRSLTPGVASYSASSGHAGGFGSEDTASQLTAPAPMTNTAAPVAAPVVAPAPVPPATVPPASTTTAAH